MKAIKIIKIIIINNKNKMNKKILKVIIKINSHKHSKTHNDGQRMKIHL